MRKFKLQDPLNKWVSLTFYIWKRYYNSCYNLLRDYDLVEDWRAECYAIGVEIACQNISEKEKLSLIQKKLYRFLVNYGFKKPKHSRNYIYPETPTKEFTYV